MPHYETVFQQDDCASDSLPYFEADFRMYVGMSLGEFMNKAERVDCDMGMTWSYSGFSVSYMADDPFYKLSEIKVKHHELKIHNEHFHNVIIGVKKFDIITEIYE